MEICAAYLQPITMDPEGMMRKASDSDVHLEADIHAVKNNPTGFAEGDWMPYLQVKYELTKAGASFAFSAARSAVREWQTLNAQVPKAVEEIQARVEKLKPEKLPKDVTKEELESAKADLETMKATWAEAQQLAQNANPIEATEKARTVQAKAAELKSSLGMEPQVASAG